MHKEMREICKVIEKAGWRIDYHRKGHAIAYPANKDFSPITIPGTPSDWRAKRNLIAQLRRAGLDI